MASSVSVHLLPDLFQPEQLAGGVAVIIDILRASTTMITALHHGGNATLSPNHHWWKLQREER